MINKTLLSRWSITKKLLTIFSLSMIMVISVSCNINQPNEIKVMVPEGSPRLAQILVEKHNEEIMGKSLKIERVFGTDPLTVAFLSGSHDIIYAPINLGAKLIDMGVEYSFIASVTWGNLFFVSEQTISSLNDLDGKTILVFGQNSIPDIICRILFDNEIFAVAPIISYVESVQSSFALLKSDTNRIALLAEPMVSMILDEYPNMNIIDLQEEWKNHYGLSSYPQSGLFVKKQLSSHIVDSYVQRLIESIEFINQEKQEVLEVAESLNLPYIGEHFFFSINRSNIIFLSAYDSRNHIINLFERILDLAGELINNRLPEESFYLWGAP
jgi:NitT/TauT family transport system substrate-binding protein